MAFPSSSQTFEISFSKSIRNASLERDWVQELDPWRECDSKPKQICWLYLGIFWKGVSYSVGIKKTLELFCRFVTGNDFVVRLIFQVSLAIGISKTSKYNLTKM
jgi:hypothetical protein